MHNNKFYTYSNCATLYYAFQIIPVHCIEVKGTDA